MVLLLVRLLPYWYLKEPKLENNSVLKIIINNNKRFIERQRQAKFYFSNSFGLLGFLIVLPIFEAIKNIKMYLFLLSIFYIIIF